MTKYLTNKTFISKGNVQSKEKPVLRKFLCIAKHKNMVWVEALNGNFGAEMLTFPVSHLFDFDEEDAKVQAQFKELQSQ